MYEEPRPQTAEPGRQPNRSWSILRHAAFLCAMLVLAGCDGGGAPTSTSDITTSTTTADTTTTTAVFDAWVWGLDEVDLGEGYVLGPCSGDADQFACLSKDRTVVGSAEHLALPVDNFAFLAGVVEPVESLELIADDYVATFSADRQSTCPNLEFRDLVPTESTVATLPGIRYGFEELDRGRIVEKNVIYGTRANETIELFAFTAIADGACLSNEGELADPDLLEGLLPTLDDAMAVVQSG